MMPTRHSIALARYFTFHLNRILKWFSVSPALYSKGRTEPTAAPFTKASAVEIVPRSISHTAWWIRCSVFWDLLTSTERSRGWNHWPSTATGNDSEANQDVRITPPISRGRMGTILILLLAKSFRICSAPVLLTNHWALLNMQGFTLSSSSSTALTIALTSTQHS